MYIYGASGHGRVIIDMIDDNHAIRGVFDDDPEKKSILGYPVIGSLSSHFVFDDSLFIAIGDNYTRKCIAESLENRVNFATIIHSSSLVSKRSHIGVGSVVMEGTIIKVACSIGKQSIINTGASLDHDCTIGDFVHIAPQATLCGGITVGLGTLIGANAIILPGCKIGQWCKVGAGSIVHKDMPDHTTWIGNSHQYAKI